MLIVPLKVEQYPNRSPDEMVLYSFIQMYWGKDKYKILAEHWVTLL